MIRWKIIGLPRMKNIVCNTRYYTIVQKLRNKQSVEVICRFDKLRTSHSNRQKKLRTSHSNRQKSHITTGKVISRPYI